MANKSNDLAHTKWMCKYHIVFTPKYRRKVIYNQLKTDIRDILKQLCSYKGVEILEGHLMPDHIHMLVSIPPKMSASSFMGITFKDFNYSKGFLRSDWVGFDNFKFFFKSSDAFRVLRNTIVNNALFIGISLVVAVAIALLLNEIRNRKFLKVTQTIMFFPYFLSWVVVGYVAYAFLSHDYGIVNSVLSNIGLEPVKWYIKAGYWPVILTLIYVWKNAGYKSIIYYASLMGVDNTYYEAAELDGASRWQRIWHISLPMIQNVIIVMTILDIGRIMFSDFGMFYQVTRDQGALYTTTDVLDTYIFRALRVSGDIGISSAVGFFQAVVGFVLIIVSNFVVSKINSESALF